MFSYLVLPFGIVLFSSARRYFDNITNPIMENMPWEKYRAWLILFGKEDNKKSQKEFVKFIEEQKIAT